MVSSPLGRFVLTVTQRHRNGRETRGKNAGSVSPFKHRHRTHSGIFNFSVCRVAWLPRVSSARDINRLGSADTTLYNQIRNTSDGFSNPIRVTEVPNGRRENCSWRGKIDFEPGQSMRNNLRCFLLTFFEKIKIANKLNVRKVKNFSQSSEKWSSFLNSFRSGNWPSPSNGTSGIIRAIVERIMRAF